MVCVVQADRPFTVGEKVRIQGGTRHFEQTVDSLQVESVNVKRAKKGQLVGLKVRQACREGDLIYRLKK